MEYIRSGVDQMLRTIVEANNLSMHAMYYYRNAACSLDHSAYNYHIVDFSEQAMNDAVQQAQIGTDMIKSSFILQAQFGTDMIKSSFILNLSQQFPMLMTIPIIPNFPSEVDNCYCQNGDYQQVELLYHNLNQFISQCEEICFHQQNVIATVGAQIQTYRTSSWMLGGVEREARQNNYRRQRLTRYSSATATATSIAVKTKAQIGSSNINKKDKDRVSPVSQSKLTTLEATSVESDSIESGGTIIISNHPDHNPESYHHTTTTNNTSNNNIEEEDNSDNSNNFALALGGRDDYIRQDNHSLSLQKGCSHHHDSDCRSINNIKNKIAINALNCASEGKGCHLMDNVPLLSKITLTATMTRTRTGTGTTTTTNKREGNDNTSNHRYHPITIPTNDVNNKFAQIDDNHDDNTGDKNNNSNNFALPLEDRDDFFRQDNDLGG